MSVNLSERVTAELLVHYFEKLKAADKELLFNKIVEGAESHTISNLLEYIKDPKEFSSDETNNLRIGDKTLVKEDAVWSGEKEYLQQNGFVVDGHFQATVVDFQVFPGTKVIVEYPSKDGTMTHTVYASYLKNIDLF